MARVDSLTNFLTDVADSIREKKGTSEPILASNFDTEIDSIQTGGSEYEYAEFDPFNVVDILDNDTEDYPSKAILLLVDSGTNQYTIRTNDTFLSYAVKVRGSDGQEMDVTYSSQTYFFDTSKDLINSLGQRVRYLIIYKNNRQMGGTGNTPSYRNFVLMSYFKNCKVVESGGEYLKNNVNTRVMKFDENCELNLKSRSISSNAPAIEEYIMPDNVIDETSSGTSYNNSFSYAYCLKKARLNLNNKITNVSNALEYCQALQEVELVNCPDAEVKVDNMINQCFVLKSFVAKPMLKINNYQYLFNSMYNLRKISGIDFANATSMNLYSNTQLAIIENIKNINFNIELRYMKTLSHDSIINVFNALVDLTGQTAKTVYLGKENWDKTTAEERAIATNKNWNLTSS